MQCTDKSEIIGFLGTVRCLGYFNYLGHANLVSALAFGNIFER